MASKDNESKVDFSKPHDLFPPNFQFQWSDGSLSINCGWLSRFSRNLPSVLLIINKGQDPVAKYTCKLLSAFHILLLASILGRFFLLFSRKPQWLARTTMAIAWRRRSLEGVAR
jgi:hypothetical protein